MFLKTLSKIILRNHETGYKFSIYFVTRLFKQTNLNKNNKKKYNEGFKQI